VRLYAVSDLHLGYEENRRMLEAAPARPDDWLILAGDVGERLDHLRLALDVLTPRFRQIVWAPGNHDLWSSGREGAGLFGAAKYERLVRLCRSYGALTPEDDYATAEFGGRLMRVAPLFLLYDYSFRPAHVPLDRALAWARESGVECADEALLRPDPYPSRAAWCHARCEETFARLSAGPQLPTILVNHFPLVESLVTLPRIPRFSLWCGTKRTADWHLRFGTEAVVYGHLHIRGTRFVDGVRFEEASLGYPRQWAGRVSPATLLREVAPAPTRSRIGANDPLMSAPKIAPSGRSGAGLGLAADTQDGRVDRG
jgi:3',5'-cyclic AMP phosphodiesterase CpdA